MLAVKKTYQETIDANLDAHHEILMARMDFQLEKTEAAVNVFEEILDKKRHRFGGQSREV
jgi:hypothetical protein